MMKQERNIIIKTKSIYTWLYTKFPVQPLVKIVLSQTSKHTQKNRFVFYIREFTLRVLYYFIHTTATTTTTTIECLFQKNFI